MSNGIDKNPLLDISKVYLEKIVEKKDDSYLETDMKKRQKNNEKARKEMEKVPGQKNPHFEEKQLDPVGQEDDDIDNDGKENTKSDKYLGKRRKAIAKAMKNRMKEEVEQIDEIIDPKGAARMDAAKEKKKVDVFAYDRKLQAQGKLKGKKLPPPPTNEGFSNWRNELTEVAPMKDEEEKEIKEKKVNNKVTINPKLGEEVVSELGGTLIEMVEYDEFDGMVEGVYFELQEEGYGQDDIEEALEWVLTEARVTYGSDTESPRQQMMNKAKGRLRFLGRKVGEKMTSAKKKVGMASAKTQVAAYNKAREAKRSVSDTAKKAKSAVTNAPKKAKKGLKAKIKGVAQKVVDRMSEEAEVDPKEKQMLAKKKTMMMKQQMLDKQRMQMQQQGKLPSGHRVEQKEEMSIADQMRISREAAAKRKPYQPGDREKQRAAQMRNAAKNAKKDTRTDAEKMADATGPRKGSNYRGD